MKNKSASTTGYTLKPTLIEVSDLSLMLESLLPNEINVELIVYDTSLRSNLTTNKTPKLTEKFFKPY